MANDCAGSDFASDGTRIDDESTRDALNLALQVDPPILPHAATIDVSEFVRQQMAAVGGSRTRLDGFRNLIITTRADAVVIEFQLRLSVP